MIFYCFILISFELFRKNFTLSYLSTKTQPQHYCMTQRLDYDEWIPTFGDHRPLWPVYGEYRYLPVQRWLHSLEVFEREKKSFLKKLIF